MPNVFCILTALLVLGCAGQAAYAATPHPPAFGSATLSMGPHMLAVELAETPKQQEYGLMFRENLAPGSGMLFVFSPPRPVGMWMKNTLIPLDMVFVDEKMTIMSIMENARPHSRDIISPGRENCAAVIELPAGDAKRLKITLGMPVSWTIPLPDAKN